MELLQTAGLKLRGVESINKVPLSHICQIPAHRHDVCIFRRRWLTLHQDVIISLTALCLERSKNKFFLQHTSDLSCFQSSELVGGGWSLIHSETANRSCSTSCIRLMESLSKRKEPDRCLCPVPHSSQLLLHVWKTWCFPVRADSETCPEASAEACNQRFILQLEMFVWEKVCDLETCICWTCSDASVICDMFRMLNPVYVFTTAETGAADRFIVDRSHLADPGSCNSLWVWKASVTSIDASLWGCDSCEVWLCSSLITRSWGSLSDTHRLSLLCVWSTFLQLHLDSVLTSGL